jgi:hypothetical protein
MTLFETDPNTKIVKATQEESPRFMLTREDLTRLGGRFGLFLLAAVVTFVAENIGSIDFGASTPIVVAVIGLVLDTVRRFITSQQYLVK